MCFFLSDSSNDENDDQHDGGEENHQIFVMVFIKKVHDDLLPESLYVNLNSNYHNIFCQRCNYVNQHLRKIGVLDIDSSITERFTEEDEEGLKGFVKVLEEKLSLE